MTAINFTMFPEKVADGSKRQTIRTDTKAKAGDALQLYTGMRTKSCRKLGDGVCKTVALVSLFEPHAFRHDSGVWLTGIGLEEFAQADGFATYADMWAFFRKRANAQGEYRGKLIKW